MGAPDEPSATDLAYLERARLIAREGWGRVQPNPMVGCVIVSGGEVVGEGYHEELGGAHGEVIALEAARGRTEGATAYVSLEPCNHSGRTPPCTDALVAAGVVRVVYGASDPGAESSGGAGALRDAGVAVVGPVWSQDVAWAENPAFFHLARHARPYVALKLAMSLDARIASSPGMRTRISGAEADRAVHRLRAGFDAVMVGIGTAEADDPRLTVRLASLGSITPARIILDPSARLSPRAALFDDVASVPVHVFVGCDVPESAPHALEAAGARVHRVTGAPGGLSLDAVWDTCWEVGIRTVLCEGGSRLAAAILREERCQRLYLIVAPSTLGPGGVPAFAGDAGTLGWDGFRPALQPTVLGRDVMLVYDRMNA